MKSIIMLFLWALGSPYFSSAQHWTKKINDLTNVLVAHPSRSAYDSLHFIVAEHYSELTDEQRHNIKNTLEKQTQWFFDRLCSDKEQGTKITIKGHVLDVHNKPIANAQLSIYHADNMGNYAPSDGALKRMSEGDPRLFGFVKTDNLGNYTFQTVRPASYPNKYNGRTIPQHIHVQTSATGYKTQAVQMAFDDDLQMRDAYWRNWAKEQHFPVVTLKKEKNGLGYGVYDVVLY